MSVNPYFTQYHTQRFSFIGSPLQRDGETGKDQRFVNLYPELIKSPISDGKKYYLKKRPGVSLVNTIPGASGQVQGFFYWSINQTYYTAIGGNLYAGNTFITSLQTSTGQVGMCAYVSSNAENLFVCDGVDAYVITPNNGLTVVTGVDGLPQPHIPTPVALDGYIFLPSGINTINNSNLNMPNSWPVDGFIDTELFSFQIVALKRVQNYIAAITTGSIEWFYDNANATGSPLERNAPAVSQFGCPAPYTIDQTELELIMVGETGNGGRTVWVINGFQPTEIGTEPVREALDNEGTSINLANAYTIQVCGHKFYVLNLTGSSRTFVYDFEEQMWHEWSGSTTLGVNYPWVYRYAADSGNGAPMLMAYTGAGQLELSPNNYTDLGVPPLCFVQTTKLDFDTIKRKRLYRLSVICDGPNGDNNVPMTVNWSDDDYNTWVGNFTLNLNSSYPTVTQLGYTRRRAFQFVYQQPYPLRLEAFEVDIIQEVRR